MCLWYRAIEAAADGSSDVIGMAYWWSNCIQLRWMLWAMCHGGEMSEDGSLAEGAQGMDEFDWVMKVGSLSFAMWVVFKPCASCASNHGLALSIGIWNIQHFDLSRVVDDACACHSRSTAS